ncbi:Smr/MutS family protein [Allosphingosinicella flava]|uniref:Smr/MutS family protein n=1 Tax=Allosphingosinicella flava TaxID=2771430 RepID=A0A7T2GL81_9SPHN|nr:Smr/MutS family protein [Sphingosinicella flava]QPQ55920.1 Smr/MutS family protein [Sphingosinicella flava]
MVRKLNAEERALWDKVVATVSPLHRQAMAEKADIVQPALPISKPKGAAPVVKAQGAATRPAIVPAKAAPVPGTTLDATWDRRLSRGLVAPDLTVDLHGHNLSTAYAMLDTRLEQAVASGARLLLLVTGKPPAGERWPVARGAIRAAVGDWLQASRHAAHIAAVRGAHPRHGGLGALYIVLRRKR